MKFFNTLPDPPCESKLLNMSLPLEEFGSFRPTSLQSDFKLDIILGHDLGLGIDIVDPKYYMLPVNPRKLDPEDEELLHGEKEAVASQQTGKKKVPLSVPWLRKSEFITSVFDENLYNQSQQIEDEDEGKYVPPERDAAALVERNLLLVRDSFQASAFTPKHPFDASLKAVSVQRVFPNREFMANELFHVQIEKAPSILVAEEAEAERANAMYRGFQFNEDGEKIPAMARVVPRKRERAEETEKKDKEEEEEENGMEEFVKTDAYRPHLVSGEAMAGKYILLDTGSKKEISYVPLEKRIEMKDLAQYFRGAPPPVALRYKVQRVETPAQDIAAKIETRFQSFFGAEEFDEEDDDAVAAGGEDKELDLNAEIAQQDDIVIEEE